MNLDKLILFNHRILWIHFAKWEFYIFLLGFNHDKQMVFLLNNYILLFSSWRHLSSRINDMINMSFLWSFVLFWMFQTWISSLKLLGKMVYNEEEVLSDDSSLQLLLYMIKQDRKKNAEILRSGEFSDFEIVVVDGNDTKVIKAHKGILWRNDVFRGMLIRWKSKVSTTVWCMNYWDSFIPTKWRRVFCVLLFSMLCELPIRYS